MKYEKGQDFGLFPSTQTALFPWPQLPRARGCCPFPPRCNGLLSSFQGKEWGPVNLLESLTLPIGKAQKAYRAAWGYLSQAFKYANFYA